MSMESRLYILVRRDLSVADQAVQAGHAVGAWCGQYIRQGTWDPWSSYLIYLGVENEFELTYWESRLVHYAEEFITFLEPDMNNQKTAIACLPYNKNRFSKLRELY